MNFVFTYSENADIYNMNKQLRSFREAGDHVVVVNGPMTFESIDEQLHWAFDKGFNNAYLITEHTELAHDFHEEYKEAFDDVRIIKAGFTRFTEADQQQNAQQTAQPEAEGPKTVKIACVYPFSVILFKPDGRGGVTIAPECMNYVTNFMSNVKRVISNNPKTKDATIESYPLIVDVGNKKIRIKMYNAITSAFNSSFSNPAAKNDYNMLFGIDAKPVSFNVSEMSKIANQCDYVFCDIDDEMQISKYISITQSNKVVPIDHKNIGANDTRQGYDNRAADILKNVESLPPVQETTSNPQQAARDARIRQTMVDDEATDFIDSLINNRGKDPTNDKSKVYKSTLTNSDLRSMSMGNHQGIGYWSWLYPEKYKQADAEYRRSIGAPEGGIPGDLLAASVAGAFKLLTNYKKPGSRAGARDIAIERVKNLKSLPLDLVGIENEKYNAETAADERIRNYQNNVENKRKQQAEIEAQKKQLALEQAEKDKMEARKAAANADPKYYADKIEQTKQELLQAREENDKERQAELENTIKKLEVQKKNVMLATDQKNGTADKKALPQPEGEKDGKVVNQLDDEQIKALSDEYDNALSTNDEAKVKEIETKMVKELGYTQEQIDNLKKIKQNHESGATTMNKPSKESGIYALRSQPRYQAALGLVSPSSIQQNNQSAQQPNTQA